MSAPTSLSFFIIRPKSRLYCRFFHEWSAMFSPFLFIRWRKEKKIGQNEEDEQILAFREFSWCVALIAVKDLLWRINCHDMVLPPEGICRIDECAFGSPIQRMLDFLLVAWSLPTGGQEPLHSVVVLLPDSSGEQTQFHHHLAYLADFNLVRRRYLALEGLPEGPSHSP